MELKHFIEIMWLFMLSNKGKSQLEKCVPDTVFNWVRCVTCNITCPVDLNIWIDSYYRIDSTDCSMGKLEKGKLDRFYKLLAFNLESVGIQSIETNAFQNLKVLENLMLDGNDLKIILNGTFNGLISLKCLQLENNFIETIMPDTFLQLKNLEKLYLSYNMLKFLNKDILNGLLSLTFFEVEKNQIEEIRSDSFINSKNMTILRFDVHY